MAHLELALRVAVDLVLTEIELWWSETGNAG